MALRFPVPLLLLHVVLFTTSAAATEHLLSPPSAGFTSAFNSTPQIATDGSTFLVAWIATGFHGSSSILVQRMPLDPERPLSRILVHDAGVAFASMSLTWGGTSYVMAWERSDGSAYVTRLDRSGAEIEGARQQIARGISHVTALASNGSRSIVIAGFGPTIRAIVLDADGVMIRDIPLPSGSAHALTAAHDRFYLFVGTETSIVAYRFDANGTLLDYPAVPVAAVEPGELPIVIRSSAAHGRLLVGWTALYDSGLHSVVINEDGTPGSPRRSENLGAGNIALAPSQGGWAVLTAAFPDEAPSNLAWAEIDATGEHGPQLLLSGSPLPRIRGFALAAAGGSFCAAWVADKGMTSTIEERVFGTIGAPPDFARGELLNLSVADEDGIDVASSGRGFLAAWIEHTNESDRTRVRRLDRDGVPEGEPLTIFEASNSFPQPPQVIHGHGIYLVAWHVYGALVAMRFDADGLPLDPSPFRVTPQHLDSGSVSFDVAVTATGFMFVRQREGMLSTWQLTPGGTASHLRDLPHAPPPAGSRYSLSNVRIADSGTRGVIAFEREEWEICVFPPCSPIGYASIVRELDVSGGYTGVERITDGFLTDIAFTDNGALAVMDTAEPGTFRLTLLDDALKPSGEWTFGASSFTGPKFVEGAAVPTVALHERSGTGASFHVLRFQESGAVFRDRHHVPAPASSWSLVETGPDRLLAAYTAPREEPTLHQALRAAVVTLPRTATVPRRRALR